MAHSTVQLTGTYTGFDGTPLKGTVEIIPSERQVVDDSDDVVLSGRIKVALDEAGSFSVELPATDDESLSPTGFGYTLAARLSTTHLPALSFQLPAAVPTVDITDLTIIDPSTFSPTLTYATDAALEEVAADVDALTVVVGTKADDATVDALTATVASKASSADLATLTATVDTKADADDLTAVQADVATRATSADLDAVEATLTTTQATVATKADAAATTASLATKADAASTSASLATLSDAASKALRFRLATLATMGDSISTNGVASGVGGPVSGAVVFGPLSYAGWALLQVGGRFNYLGSTAATGQTTTQMRTGQLPTMKTSAPAVCVVLGGTNNEANSVTLAQAKVDLATIYTELLSVGTLPIAATVPPQGTSPKSYISKLNAWIRNYARVNGLPCVDFHEVLVQHITGGFSLSGDNTHPNSVGAKLMGDRLAATLNALPNQPHAPQLAGGFDTNAMMQDPTFGVVTGHWTESGTGTSASTTSATFAWKGNKRTLTASGAGNARHAVGTVTNQPVAGHRISFTARVDATVAAGGLWNAIIGNTSSGVIAGYFGMDQALPVGSMLAFDFLAAAGQITPAPWTVNYSVTTGATSTVAFAETSLLDLTALEV